MNPFLHDSPRSVNDAHADLIARLRARLEAELPGREAQWTMGPSTRKGRSTLDVERRACREGAVLALLFPYDEATGLVLTKRPNTLSAHAGQVSFPGGRREDGETLVDTALRETQEELGVPAEAIAVLGPLTPLYIPPTRFCVYPFVGALDHRPRYRPSPVEVDRVIEVDLGHIRDPANRREEDWTLRGRPARVPFYAIDGETVWGATAMMLAELVALLDP